MLALAKYGKQCLLGWLQGKSPWYELYSLASFLHSFVILGSTVWHTCLLCQVTVTQAYNFDLGKKSCIVVCVLYIYSIILIFVCVCVCVYLSE